jgi:hypothetical protein
LAKRLDPLAHHWVKFGRPTANQREISLPYIKASQSFERIAYPLLGAIGTAFFFPDRNGECKLEPLAAAQALKG